MAIATRTINPLHFEDLEPHRFEDLARQLIYDFRDWTSLEATGRQGSDEGFDARGWEVAVVGAGTTDEEGPEELVETKVEEDRVWLIQCKREKAISPKKLNTYLNAIGSSEASALYGLIFVASCDFSKKSRDEFRKWCGERGIREFHIWGKADLEDMLFHPKNDHLLFGYFGISLQIKKRSAKTTLRSILATKRQVIRHLGDVEGFYREPVLLRDPDAKEYPYSEDIENFDEVPLWRVYDFIGHYHSGIKILIRKHFAYLADDGVKWDCEERIRTNTHYDDPWPKKVEDGLERKARHFWMGLPEQNRATLEVIGLIPYDDILAIDENGDDIFPHPHIYVRFDKKAGTFIAGAYADLSVSGSNGRTASAEKENQIKYFPSTYPDAEEEQP